jgi:hypothetical protein
MGLMLTVEFVDGSITYMGESLKEKARLMALRIIDYYDFLFIENPVTGTLCNSGNNSAAFAFSIVHIREYFNNEGKNNMNDQIYLWGSVPEPCGNDNNYQVNRSLYAVITALANSTPYVDMCRYVDNRDGFDWGFYYLLRKALYPVGSNYDESGCNYTANEVRWDLELCPCRGPYWDQYKYTPDGTYKTNGEFQYNFGSQNTYPYKPDEWHFPNRYLKTCDDTMNTKGEFNGIDYMLLFNLGKIVYGNDAISGDYTNMRNYYFSKPLVAGNTYTPVGFNYLTTDVTVPNTARVDARASKFITLEPGFNVDGGGYFLGEIETVWTCDGITYKSAGLPPAPPRNIRTDMKVNVFGRNESFLNTDSGMAQTVIRAQSLLPNEPIFYPNPASDIIHLSCATSIGYIVRLSDGNGKFLLEQQVICGSFISLSSFAPGLYTIELSGTDAATGEFKQYYFKIVKAE